MRCISKIELKRTLRGSFFFASNLYDTEPLDFLYKILQKVFEEGCGGLSYRASWRSAVFCLQNRKCLAFEQKARRGKYLIYISHTICLYSFFLKKFLPDTLLFFQFFLYHSSHSPTKRYNKAHFNFDRLLIFGSVQYLYTSKKGSIRK